MKLHTRLFLLSLLIIIVAIVAVQMMEFQPSTTVVAQSEATAYFITFVGVILSFRWYKQKAELVDNKQPVPNHNLVLQRKVLYILLGINILNAFILLISQKESVQMMVGISLLVLLISPHVFRTMHEKEAISDQSEREMKE